MDKVKQNINNILGTLTYYKLLNADQRRDLKYITNMDNIRNVFFSEIDNKNINMDINILFKGWGFSSLDFARNFDMERLLLVYYFSFYFNKSIYLQFKDTLFEVNYNKSSITKVNTIPEIQLILSRSGALKDNENTTNKYLSKNIKKIVVTPVNSYKQPVDFMYDNSFLFKVPDPEINKRYIINSFNKMNIIVIVGTIYSYKGQYEFLKNINREIIKDYVILLLGNKTTQSYYNNILDISKEKNINIIHYFVHPKKLDLIIPKCKFQVSYCCNKEGDPNPRSITEGLYAGLPFLVTEYVTIPNLIKNNNKIGLICKPNDPIDLNNKMEQLLQLKNEDVLTFIKDKGDYNKVCRYTLESIMEKYENLKS